MKKRILSVAVALTLLMSIVVPANIANAAIPQYFINVEVVDHQTEAQLEGAVFGFVDRYGNPVIHQTVDPVEDYNVVNGQSVLESVGGYYRNTVALQQTPGGIFYIKEITAPTGYEAYNSILDLNTDDFPSIGGDEFCTNVTFTNRKLPSGSIKIQRLNDIAYPVSGSVFGFVDQDGNPVIVTDIFGSQVNAHEGQSLLTASGPNHTAKDLPYGSYYVQEITAPAGVALDSSIVSLTISSATKNPTMNVPNIPSLTGKITITSVDENGLPMDDAFYCFVDANGDPTVVYDVDGNAINHYPPNFDYSAFKRKGLLSEVGNLPAGTYFVKQISSASSRLTNQSIHQVTLEPGNMSAEITVLQSLLRGSISIQVTDEQGRPLHGAVLGFVGPANTPIIVKDADGNPLNVVDGQSILMATGDWYVADNLRAGVYSVREMIPPPGYMVDTTGFIDEYHREFSGQSWSLSVSETSGAVDNYLTVRNLPLTSGSITVNNEDNDSNPLSGGTFGFVNWQGKPMIVKDADGNDVNVVNNQSLMTPSGNTHVTANLPCGTYYIAEMSVPSGFLKQQIIKEITVYPREMNPAVTVTHRPLQGGSVTVKTKSEFGKTLHNATYIFCDSTGDSIIIYDEDNNPINVREGENFSELVPIYGGSAAYAGNLPYGTYYFYQVDTPLKYEIDQTIHSFTLSPGNEHFETTVLNSSTPYPLCIWMEDEDGNPLSGAVLGFVDEFGNPIIVNDHYGNPFNVVNGQSLLEADDNLHEATGLSPDRDYYVRQMVFPPGYMVDLNWIAPHKDEYCPNGPWFKINWDLAGDASTQVTLDLRNTPEKKGGLTINKTDGTNPLSGATFGFVSAAGQPKIVFDIHGNPVNKQGNQSMLSTSGATHSASNLPYGNYYVKEMSAPAGFTLDNTVRLMKVGAANENPNITVANGRNLGSITILKTDGSNPLTGATFGFCNSAGVPIIVKDFSGTDINVVNGRSMLTAAGAAHTAGSLAHGTYYVREITAPDGYYDEGTVYKMVIDSVNQNITQNVENELIRGSITINKINDNGQNLSGAKFGFYDADENPIIVYDADGNTVNVKNGQSMLAASGADHSASNLKAGGYFVKEVQAPTGYIKSNDVYNFVIGDNGDIISHYSITVMNDKESPVDQGGKLFVFKTDEHGNDLTGATFGFVDTAGRPVVVKDADGHDFNVVAGQSVLKTESNHKSIHYAYPLKVGTYYVKEISAPNGYEPDTKTHAVRILTETTTVQLTVQNEKIPPAPQPPAPEPPKPQPPAPEPPKPQPPKPEPPAPVTPEKPASPFDPKTVIISKTDATDASPLAGAEITIWDEQQNEVYRGITDDKGQVSFVAQKPGKYTFRETKAPAEYDINETVFTFSVHENGSLTGKTEIKDCKTGTVVITKIDVLDGVELPGATIRVEDAKGNIVFEQVSDEYGKIYFFPPAPGAYTFYETTPPDGYYLNEDKFQFTVDAHGRITSGMTYLENVPYGTVVIKKTDVNDGKELQDAEIAIWDMSGQEVFRGMTDERGRVYFVSPGPGTYTYKETIAPKGYLINEDTFSFGIDESFMIKGTTKIQDQRMPSIPKTGIVDITPYAWGALAITILALGISLYLYPRKRKRTRTGRDEDQNNNLD